MGLGLTGTPGAVNGGPRGTLRNYSNSRAYEEAEGVDATGDAVYVERDLDYDGTEPGALDIWRLGLDDGRWEHVTRFNETEGQGDGILLLDLP